MTDEIQKAVEDALTAVEPSKANLFMPPHVAANIVEMLKRVTVTGMEAYALVEAVTILNAVALPPPQGPGVQFPGLPGR